MCCRFYVLIAAATRLMFAADGRETLRDIYITERKKVTSGKAGELEHAKNEN